MAVLGVELDEPGAVARTALAAVVGVNLRGGAGADTLSGGAGDDVIDGRGGADRVEGGDGDDVLSLGDILDGDVLDLVFAGGDGFDTIDTAGLEARGFGLELTVGDVGAATGSSLTLTPESAGSLMLGGNVAIVFTGLESILIEQPAVV